MTTLFAWVAFALHLALTIVAAPLLHGGLAWFEARLAGRAGPDPRQTWRVLRRLAQLPPCAVTDTSALGRAAPALALAAVIAASALVPTFALGLPTADLADAVLIAGLLGSVHALRWLAAMDAGTAAAGTRAAAATARTIVAVPVLLSGLLAVGIAHGTTNLDLIGRGDIRWPMLLALPCFVCCGVLATSPAPDPADLTGADLALTRMADTLVLLTWMNWLGVLFWPHGLADADVPTSWPLGLLAWTARMAITAALLAVGRCLQPRPRLEQLGPWLTTAALAGWLAAILLLSGQALA